ncbi:hypothetical protein AURDEDRAFT_115373 [Auricularia subglabra TFB-10046 SS5]|nr:hypothetical protein AURDEDRAFT_115373 [Auricularia subglabra TFB-10046 SS5]
MQPQSSYDAYYQSDSTGMSTLSSLEAGSTMESSDSGYNYTSTDRRSVPTSFGRPSSGPQYSYYTPSHSSGSNSWL